MRRNNQNAFLLERAGAIEATLSINATEYCDRTHEVDKKCIIILLLSELPNPNLSVVLWSDY